MPVSTAALIARADTFLFVRRMPGGDLGECWELPGGKVDPGETSREALGRELSEELNITGVVGDQVGVNGFVHRGREFELQAYLVEADTSSLELREHTDLRWERLADSLSLELAPSDRDLIEKLLAAGFPGTH